MDSSLSNELAECEERLQRSDLIYRVLLQRETSEIDGHISDFIKKLVAQTKGTKYKFSKRFHTITKEAIQGNDRHLKQCLFFWYIYTFKDFADSLVDEQNPQVPPDKFKRFRDDPENLRLMCSNLLDTHYCSLREFVNKTRICYFMA